MLSGIIGRLRWILVIALIGGPVFAFMSYQDNQRLDNLKENGVQASAYIESGEVREGRRSGKTFKVNLTWEDENGEARRADGVTISGDFANQIIQNDTIMVDYIDVLYLGDATVKPAVVGDLEEQISQNDLMMKVGAGAGGVGLIGVILMLVFRGKKKPAAEAPAA